MLRANQAVTYVRTQGLGGKEKAVGGVRKGNGNAIKESQSKKKILKKLKGYVVSLVLEQ